MKIIRSFLLLVGIYLSAAHSASAWVRGDPGPPGATGGTVINVPVVGGSSPIFANFFQTSSLNTLSASNWGLLSDTGLPNGNVLAANYTFIPTLPAASTSTVFVIDWPGSLPANSITHNASTTATGCSSAAHPVLSAGNCATDCITSGGSGTGQTVWGKAGANGTNCRVEFTYVSAPTGAIGAPNTFWNSGVAPNTTAIRLFRRDDETNNGGTLPLFNPDFIASFTSGGVNARIARFMGNILNSGGENLLTNPSYALRTPIGSASYGSSRYPYSQIGVGVVSQTGNNWLAGSSYSGQPAGWTDKEVFQGNFVYSESVTVTSGTPATVTFAGSVPAGTAFNFSTLPSGLSTSGVSPSVATTYYTLTAGTSSSIALSPGGSALSATGSGSFTVSRTGFGVISAAGSAGASGLIRLALPDTSGLTTGQVIAYTGFNAVGGPGYGLWTITVVDGTHIDLATSYPAGNSSSYTTTYSQTPGFITTLTVQLSGRATSVPLVGPSTFPTGANGVNVVQNNIGTCMYDGQVKAAICSPNGLYTGLSYELAVSLANTTKTDLWINLSSNFSDASMASLAQMVSSNLSPALNVYIEYSNEPWNPFFYQYFFHSKKAEAVGITTTPSQASNSGSFSWVGLRSTQLLNIFLANWSGAPSRVKGLFNVQYAPGANGNGAVANTFNGTLLNPTNNSVLCVYLGGTFSGTCSGAANYSVSPNRPIDLARAVSPAPYNGNKFTDGQYGRNLVTAAANNGSGAIRLTIGSVSPTPDNAAQYLSTGLSMTVQGVRGTTEANSTWTITKIDNNHVDLQGSTFTHAYTGGGIMGNANYPFNLAVTYQSNPSAAISALSTLMISSPLGGYQSSTSMSEWNTTLTTYDAGRPSGYGPLEIVCYEGGPDIFPPSVSDYTTMGLSSSGTVTFNVGSSPAVNQTGHPYINGSKVNFSGGSGFTGISTGQDYFVINATANSYDVSKTYYGATAVLVGGTPTGTTTATGSTTSVDNLNEGFKNSSAASSWIVSYDTWFKSGGYILDSSPNHYKRSAMLQMVGNSWDLTTSVQNGPNRWSLYQQFLSPSIVAPYQFVNGLQQIH